MALALNGGAGNRGLVLFAMHKRNITAIYTTFYFSTFEAAFAFHFFFFLASNAVAICHAPLGAQSRRWEVNVKDEKAQCALYLSLSVELWLRLWIWILCLAMRARLFPCCLLLLWLFWFEVLPESWQQQQQFDQSSTGLWREKLDAGVSLSFRQEFEYLLGLLTSGKSKVSHSNELVLWTDPNESRLRWSLNFPASSCLESFVSATLCCI